MWSLNSFASAWWTTYETEKHCTTTTHARSSTNLCSFQNGKRVLVVMNEQKQSNPEQAFLVQILQNILLMRHTIQSAYDFFYIPYKIHVLVTPYHLIKANVFNIHLDLSPLPSHHAPKTHTLNQPTPFARTQTPSTLISTRYTQLETLC